MSIFSDRLRQLRLENDEKQSDIAAILGVSVQSYSAYEAAREPNYTLLRKIAEHYNVTIDYLLGKENGRTFESASVSKITGLSDRAVVVLSMINKLDLKNETPDECTFVDALNCLIECEPTTNVIPSIGRYLQTYLRDSYIITTDGTVLDIQKSNDEEIDEFCIKPFVGGIKISPETFDNVQLQDVMDELKNLKSSLCCEDTGFTWTPSV